MKKILIQIEYNGSQFSGWQKQKNSEIRTVQGELESCLSKFLKEEIQLFSSGRTDSGVHAINQYAHFVTNSNFDFSKLAMASKMFLPNDVTIKSAKEVATNFHARYCVKSKTYYYACYISKTYSPIFDNFALQIKYSIDEEKMKKAMAKFIGKHDFTSFCQKRENDKEESGESEKIVHNKGNIRTIYSFEYDKIENLIIFKICGNGFLYNMVRIIVGTVLDVARGQIALDDIEKIFEKKNRTFAGKTIKASGLYLYDVKY